MRLLACAALVTLAGWLQTPSNSTPLVIPLPAGLVRAAAYVEHFEETFSSVVWREQSRQEVRVDRVFSSGLRSPMVTDRRTLDAEMFFLWLPGDASWIAVRDVIASDGQERAAADRRLRELLGRPSFSAGQLRVLAAENGRYDIGSIQRTFTEPTLVLLFLDPHYRQRFAFTLNAARTVRGRSARIWNFVERGAPTVIRNRDRDLPASGTLTVDAASGEILETTLVLRAEADQLKGEMSVRFGTHSAFDVLVPLEMRERYVAAGEQVTTVARYSGFRRFATSGRLIPE